MATFTHHNGDMLLSDTEALVNTVNTVGVMGKGIALQFKRQYPGNYDVYRKAYANGSLAIGSILVVEESTAFGHRYIFNFPTKEHWRHPSKYEYIEAGLEALRKEIEARNIKSIAIPPLGCGNGKLSWSSVRQMIIDAFEDVSDLRVELYPPKEATHTEDAPNNILTPARALLLYSLYRFETEGECINPLVVNKIAYFLQRLGQPLGLEYKAHFYGPYASAVEPFARVFAGNYLSRQAANATMSRPHDDLELEYRHLSDLKAYLDESISEEQQDIIKQLDSLLKGFRSTQAIEILSTVDYIREQSKTSLSIPEIRARAAQWSNRKEQLLTAPFVAKAIERLDSVAFPD